MTVTRRLLVLLFLLALPLAACSHGGECDTCSADSDCNSGLYCRPFTDENGVQAGTRCSSGVGATRCRVR